MSSEIFKNSIEDFYQLKKNDSVYFKAWEHLNIHFFSMTTPMVVFFNLSKPRYVFEKAIYFMNMNPYMYAGKKYFTDSAIAIELEANGAYILQTFMLLTFGFLMAVYVF